MSRRGQRREPRRGRLPVGAYREQSSQSQSQNQSSESQYEPVRQRARTREPSPTQSSLSSILTSVPSSFSPFRAPQRSTPFQPSPTPPRRIIPYTFMTTRFNRRGALRIPGSFTYRYIRTPEHPFVDRDPLEGLRALNVLATQMRREIAQACAPHLFPNIPYNQERTERAVLGMLVLSNIDNAGVRTAPGFQYLHLVTGQQLMDIIDSMHQSGSDIWIEGLEFSFHIDPSRMTGGGSVTGVPKTLHCGYANPVYQKTHTSWSDEQGVINCAAYALNYAMNSRSKRYYQKSDERICRDARQLQTQLGWGDRVTLEDLPKFVEAYPSYRLSCLFAAFTNNALNTWVGEHFDDSVFEAERFVNSPPESKVLYLLLDVASSHYVAIHSPQQLYSHVRNTTVLWCHRCVLVRLPNLTHNCQSHLAGEPDQPKQRHQRCEFCQTFVTAENKCTCDETRCKQCKAKRGRGYDPQHRCIVYKNPEREKKTNDFNHGEPPDGSIPCLWAYDFESCTTLTETVTETVDEFEVDDEFRYTGQVISYSRETNSHKVNFIVAINVFTGERKEWMGDNGLHDFIMFMATFNNGLNVLYAHNASGYDTRLLFEVATRITNLETTMFPILRGGKFMQLKIGNCVYRDSLLHVPGSLKALTKDFCGEDMMAKGYFPHLFNTVENYEYVGSIPAKKYFDLGFSLKNERDYQTFNDWFI